MPTPRLNWLLALVPLAVVLHVAQHPVATFLVAAVAILPLAALIGQATEQLALRAGPRIGGLLNATFGNATELIVCIFLLRDGQVEVVKASLTGSILGNLLMVLGVSLILGGLRHSEQHYNAQAAGVHASSMTLAVIGLLMPALFELTSHDQDLVHIEVISGVVAGVLMLLYVLALVFTLVTHEHLFRTPTEEERPDWSLRRSLLTLLGCTLAVATMSEMLVEGLDPALGVLHLSKFFVGLLLVPVLGNAAEYATAVMFARRNKLDVTFEVATGSSTQVALFVAPALVFISLMLGHPMDFLFSPFEVSAVGLAVIIVARISQDGKANWLEGAQLVGAYLIMAVSFFFVGR